MPVYNFPTNIQVGDPGQTTWANSISTALNALGPIVDGKAPLTSPALTGTPTAPTAAAGDNSTQIATTAFVMANGGGTGTVVDASETVKGKVELATAAETTTGTDNTRAVHPAGLKVELDKKAPLASPGLTGVPTAPTAAPGTATTQLATTAFVASASSSVPLASETVAGKVELATAAETQTGADNTRAVHPLGLKTELDKKANVTSPALLGVPTAPTAAPGTNTTQVGTTAFTTAAINAFILRVPIQVTQAEYNLLTPIPGQIYFITAG